MDEARIVCDFIEHGGDRGGAGRRASRRAVSPGFDFERDLQPGGDRQPDDDARRASRWRSREEIRRSIERRYGAEARGGSLPLVRHDLLRHPGAAGRGARAAPGAARRHGRGGRLQLEQHLPPRGAGAVAGRAHLPHRGRRRGGPRLGRHPPPADRHQARGHDGRLARRRAGSSASRPAPPRRTTRSARRSPGSAPWPASPRSCAPRRGEPHRMPSSISATPSSTA